MKSPPSVVGAEKEVPASPSANAVPHAKSGMSMRRMSSGPLKIERFTDVAYLPKESVIAFSSSASVVLPTFAKVIKPLASTM